MQLSNHVTVKASPQEVFALVNDVERVVSCMPGAALTGRDGDAWQGRVKVKVGPITAAYAGTVRFLEVDEERRTLRVQATGADTHGSGDAEAAVALEVGSVPEGAELRLETDLVIRGKIAQFGKGAVNTVSDKLLQQFAQNLGSLLDQDRAAAAAQAPAGPAADASGTTPAATARPVPVAATPAAVAESSLGDEELNGLAMLVPPKVAKYAPLAGAFAFGLFEGWLLGRVLTREKQQAPCGRVR